MLSDDQSCAAHSDLMPELGEALRGLAVIERARRTSSDGARPWSDRWSSVATDSFPGYELLREIHRGGQGIVYCARQHSTDRDVALKVLLDGAFAGSLDRGRFEREVKLLAALRHPNIVTIHDSGTAAGHFFFVMDYIAGQPLDLYTSGRPRSIKQTLMLFSKICDAVNAAHARGIIHRDLKPANIRVDERGEPYILDFGLAKVARPQTGAEEIATHAATLTGQFVGSLPWAAPEQADGSPTRIETRTDVYALGVILYQLLTDEFPYRVVGPMHEVVQRILREAPLPPRKLRRDIDEELETIVLKCLSKEPQRRYQTAGELGRDIERYLRGEPLDAQRDSLAYLLRKSLRRHWVSASTAVAFVLVIAAGLAVSLTLWRTAAIDRDEAIAARQAEETARGHATQEAARAGSVNDFLQAMLASADPDAGGGRDLTVRTVLDEAARRIESAATAPPPQVEAAVRMTLGRSYLSLTYFDAAEQHLERARQLHEQLYGPHSEAYATSLQWLGVLQRKRGDLAGAEKLQCEALTLFRRLKREENALAGYASAELALVIGSQGRRDESIALTHQAIEILQRTLGREHVDVVELESTLAAHLPEQQGALDLAQRAVEATRAAYGDAHPRVARSLRRLAGGLLARGNQDAAQERYEEALALLRASFGDANHATLECVTDLVFLHAMRGEHEQAFALSAEFLPAADATYGTPSAYGLYHLQMYAKVLRRAGDLEGCERTYREGIEASRSAPLSGSGSALAFRQNLADLLLDRGAFQEAATLVEETQTMADERPGNFSPTMVGRSKCQRGEILIGSGKFAEAEALIVEGVRQIRATRLASESNRQRAAQAVIHLYEAWHAAEPGMGHDEQAAEWRAALLTAPTAPDAPASSPTR